MKWVQISWFNIKVNYNVILLLIANIITISLSEPMLLILLIAVFGCADIKVPMFAWYKREGDVATIGCENQDLTWMLSVKEADGQALLETVLTIVSISHILASYILSQLLLHY